MLIRLLLSFLPTLPQVFAQQPIQNQPQKAAFVPSPKQVNSATSPSVIALSLAIIDKESEADFKAVNSHSGALGFAQIMPANLSEWSQELLGSRLTPDEFLNSPYLQLKIVEHKLSEYWQEALIDSSGDEELAVLRVASYWYSGDPDLHTFTGKQLYRGANGQLHRYPSVAEYSNSVLKKYKHYRRTLAVNQEG